MVYRELSLVAFPVVMYQVNKGTQTGDYSEVVKTIYTNHSIHCSISTPVDKFHAFSVQ